MYLSRPLALAAILLLTCACQVPAAEPAPTPRPSPDGKMCGGFAGFQCGSGEFCDYGDQQQCVRIADAAGVCRPRPQVCTQQYDQVCGCDGKTYGNACTATSQGASVAYKGECKPPR